LQIIFDKNIQYAYLNPDKVDNWDLNYDMDYWPVYQGLDIKFMERDDQKVLIIAGILQNYKFILSAGSDGSNTDLEYDYE
jgi:hypothetical protein